MGRLTSLVVGLCVMTLSGSAVAQNGPGTIGRSFTDVVKVGHEAQYGKPSRNIMPGIASRVIRGDGTRA